MSGGAASGAALAAAAEGLVGCRFRLHGRTPDTGLDCLGLLAAALAALGRPAPLPTGYGLRTGRIAGLDRIVAVCGLAVAEGAPRAGDVLLLRIGPCQLHLVIAADADRFVQAHAGLRRVVTGPGPLAGSIVGHWRLS